MNDYTHFRFEGPVVKHYDLINHVASAGLDFWWRGVTAARVARFVARGEHPAILDLACGTGDMALALTRRALRARIIGSDPSGSMLRWKHRLLKKRGAGRLHLVQAVGELPFADGAFSAVTCAFGFRNFTAPAADLAEIHRLLAPGGRLYVLDFFRPASRFQRFMLYTLNRLLFPLVVGVLGADRASYRYLIDSVFAFRTPTEFAALAAPRGLRLHSVRSFCFGLVHLVELEKEAGA